MRHMVRHVALGAWLLAMAAATMPAHAAEPDDAARQAYTLTCARCHGLVTEARVPFGAQIVPVVMAPQGPNLTGVFGRPAGSIPGFRYSDALRKAAAAGLVWDAPSLDRVMTDSQAMLPGSYMFQKTPELQRRLVLEYLRATSRP